MTFIQLDDASVSLTRFALSPLAETMATITDAYVSSAETIEWRWLHQDKTARGILSLLTHTKYIPDFVAIPPAGMETRIEDELQTMASTPDTDAQRTLSEARQASWDTHDPTWISEPNVARTVARVFRRAWDQIEPDWPRRRAILERDIRHRAGLIATGGWHQALTGIHHKVRWVEGNRIQFSAQQREGPTVTQEGLALVPHTAGTGRWICEAPPRFAMVYPARGRLAPPTVPEGLQTLLGSTRSQIIELVQQPTTPSELAILLSKSLGTIAGHLAALESAGIVSKARVGRAMHYSLTRKGEVLASILF